MTWLLAFGWLPVPVFYVTWMRGGFAGLVLVVLINEKYRDDRGLHEHELEHVEQAWRGFIVLWWAQWLFSREARLRLEVDAYRRQLAVYGPGADATFAVRALAEEYDLGLTKADAFRLLTERKP